MASLKMSLRRFDEKRLNRILNDARDYITAQERFAEVMDRRALGVATLSAVLLTVSFSLFAVALDSEPIRKGFLVGSLFSALWCFRALRCAYDASKEGFFRPLGKNPKHWVGASPLLTYKSEMVHYALELSERIKFNDDQAEARSFLIKKSNSSDKNFFKFLWMKKSKVFLVV